MMDYQSFLATKTPRAMASGFEPTSLPNHLFDFQQACVDFCIRQGRAGLYLDTGLGKTRCQLEWASQTAKASNGKAILLTPLAVAKQIEREAQSLGYEARVIRDQSQARDGINICNYDRLDKIDADAFGAVSIDEASVLKSFNGKTTAALCAMFDHHRFRLAATATPAPNDHMELGNQSAFLGIMPANEMLMRWFINDTAEASQQWRLKGHAERDFYDWLSSWSRMAEKPSDITGNLNDDNVYKLPPLNIIRHQADRSDLGASDGGLFGVINASATTMFDLKRQTQGERIKTAIEIIYGQGKWTNQGRTDQTLGGESATPKTLNTRQSVAPKTTNGSVGNTPKTLHTGKNNQDTQPSVSRELQNGNVITTGSNDTISTQQNIGQSFKRRAEGAQFAGQPNDSTLTIATSQAPSGESFAKTATGGLETFGIASKTSSAPRNILSDWWVIWVDTNEEQDAIYSRLGDIAVSIKGNQPIAIKEELHDQWLSGDKKVLISKPSIFGYGCNWQHCHNVIYVGRTFSYEAWYQSVRRCWRFGQKRPVNVHLIVAEGEDQIGRVIDRKSDDHASMKAAMALAMARATGRRPEQLKPYNPTYKGRLPSWLAA